MEKQPMEYRRSRPDGTFAHAILNSLTAHIAVLDGTGAIVSVNEAWRRFAIENGSSDDSFYVGASYLAVCEAALRQGDDGTAEAVLDGLRLILRGEQDSFSLEYPCPSPNQARWFMLHATRLRWQGSGGIVVAHENITLRKQVEEQLAYDAQLLANVNDVIIGTDETFTITFWNRAAERLFGWSLQEVLGRTAAEVLRTEFSDTDRATSARDLAESGNWVGEVTQYAKDGRALHFEANIMALHKQDGTIAGYVSANRDITRRKLMERALQESEARFRHLSAILPDAVYTLDLVSGQTTYFNHDTFLGYSRDELLSSNSLLHALHPDDAPIVMAHWQQVMQGAAAGSLAYRLRNKASEWEWVESREVPVSRREDGTPKEIMVILSVITERKQAEEEMRRAHRAIEVANRELQAALVREQHIARIDGLTQVNNRRYFFDLARYEFAVAQRYKYPLSVILFDLDHFKRVNDSYGHQVGDQVLQQVAQRVRDYLREADILARYGGEEFIILLPNTTAAQAREVAERIREGIATHSIDTEQGEVKVTTSLGVAGRLPLGDNLDRLIHRADIALYAAKGAGRNRTQLFSSSAHS